MPYLPPVEHPSHTHPRENNNDKEELTQNQPIFLASPNHMMTFEGFSSYDVDTMKVERRIPVTMKRSRETLVFEAMG
jgi:hypothetical protein